jgi:hypothetical protein
MSPAPPNLQRLQTLIRANTGWLRQAIRLVAALNDTVYADSPAGLSPHKAGSHMRHILDFYDSFLAGVESGAIDYDARDRDRQTERDRLHAMARMHGIIGRLEAMRIHPLGEALVVRMEDAEDGPGLNPWMRSSVTRELQTLSSHTIHHFALIALTLKAHGVAVDPDFGMAPATLRYAKRQEAA